MRRNSVFNNHPALIEDHALERDRRRMAAVMRNLREGAAAGDPKCLHALRKGKLRASAGLRARNAERRERREPKRKHVTFNGRELPITGQQLSALMELRLRNGDMSALGSRWRNLLVGIEYEIINFVLGRE